MKILKYHIALIAAVMFTAGFVRAQIFSEPVTDWKIDVIRQSGADTIRIDHSILFPLAKLDDTTTLIYHEPMPDHLMPRTAIMVGVITVQAEDADEVIEILEREARRNGADWIVGFNEPRMKYRKDIGIYYRSTAILYRVLDPTLVPLDDIVTISPRAEQLADQSAVERWLQKYVHDIPE